MGNKTNQVEINSSSESLMNNIKHPKLFNSKLIRTKDDEEAYLETVQSVQSKEIYHKWKKGIEKYSVGDKEIESILVPKNLLFEEKGICGSSGIVKAKYTVLPFVLSEEILNRASLKQPFTEEEIWYLIYIVNLAGSTAHSRDLILGDIRPENILMSENGEICVCCLQSFLEEEQNYHKTLSLKIKTYLSPEQIKDLQQGKDNPTTDEKISENFSIGLSVLSAILLRNEEQLYGIDYSFDEQLFWKEIANLRNNTNYCNFLKQVVEGLLAIDPSKRLASSEVIRILRPYEEQILNLDSFQFDRDSISSEILQKLNNNQMMSSRGTEYRKVINNNDFNGNSRVQYAISPRGFRERESQFEVIEKNQRGDIRVVNEISRGNDMGNAGYTVTESLYAPMQQEKIVQSGVYVDGVAGLAQYESQVIESSHNPHESQYRQAPIQNQRLLIIPQPIHNLSINPRSPEIFSYNSNIQSPQQPNFPHHLNIHHNVSHPHNQQFQMRNPEIEQTSKYSSNSYQSGSFHTNSQMQTQPQIQEQYTRNVYEGTKSGSLINQEFSNRFTDQRREASSIQPKDLQGRDNRYESYESAMKNIDQKLTESRRLFPDNL